MPRTKLRTRAHRDRNRSLSPRRLSHKLALIDDRDNAACAELKEVMVHLAEDRFRQAVFEVNATVRMYKILFVVMTKERSEAEAFNVQVCIAQKTGAAGAECGRHAVAAVTIRVQRDDLIGANFFAGSQGTQREFRD